MVSLVLVRGIEEGELYTQCSKALLLLQARKAALSESNYERRRWWYKAVLVGVAYTHHISSRRHEAVVRRIFQL